MQTILILKTMYCVVDCPVNLSTPATVEGTGDQVIVNSGPDLVITDSIRVLLKSKQ